jgi:ABC-2 type transport system ATP-binding protein
VLTNGAPVSDRSGILFYMPDGIMPWRDQRAGWVLEYVVQFFRGRAALRAEVVDRLQLGGLTSQTVGALSKGQRKRLLLAIALLTPQRLLLIDEPFDGLDLRQTQDAAATLRWHATEHGRTLLLSIHQIADAASVCDRFVLLSGGRVRGEGTLEELVLQAKAQRAPLAGDRLEDIFLALT